MIIFVVAILKKKIIFLTKIFKKLFLEKIYVKYSNISKYKVEAKYKPAHRNK